VIRKMRRKYEKLHNEGYYTSEEELDERFEQSDEKKELDKMRFERIDAKRTKRDIKASIAKATKTETKNYYESLLHPEDNNDDIEEVFNEDDKVVVQIDGQSTKRDPPFSKKLKHKKLKQKNQIKNEENVNSNNKTTAEKRNENNLGSSDAERSDKKKENRKKIPETKETNKAPDVKLTKNDNLNKQTPDVATTSGPDLAKWEIDGLHRESEILLEHCHRLVDKRNLLPKGMYSGSPSKISNIITKIKKMMQNIHKNMTKEEYNLQYMDLEDFFTT